MLGAGIIMLFCVDYILNRNSKSSTLYICFFCSTMVGLLTGYLTLKSLKVGAFLVGGWLGYVLSLVIYSAFLFKI